MPDPITISGLFALLATYARERKTVAGEQATDDFRQQMLDILSQMMDEIQGVSDDYLASIQAEIGNHGAALGRIEQSLAAIGKQVGAYVPSSLWGHLSDDEKLILINLTNHVGPWGPDLVDVEDLAKSLDREKSEIVSNLRHLREQSIIRMSESSGGISASVSAAGILLEWVNRNNSDASNSATRINACLAEIDANDSARVAAIAESADVPISITSTYLITLSEMKFLEYQKRDGQCENNLVWNITERLRRNPPNLDKVVAFAIKP